MRKRTVPRCANNCGKTARKDSYFCSDKCGCAWAEGYLGCGEMSYCDRCQYANTDTSQPYPCMGCGYDPRQLAGEDEDA